jgi:predicted nucleic acid-binding protein
VEHNPIIFHPTEIQPADDRLYFFDANVWLQLLRPYNVRPDMRPYVELWRKLRATGRQCIVANAVVVSEVFNRFLRIRFDEWKRSPEAAAILKGASADYKRDFRPSVAHKDSVDLFLGNWQDIAYYVTYLETEVESSIVPEMLKSYRTQTDFNDRYYTEFCKAHNLRLVSHDGDFYVGGLEVVTANQSIIDKYREMNRKKR